MKKKNYLSRMLLWGAVSLGMAACSSEAALDVVQNVEPTANEVPRIAITVKTPTSDAGVVIDNPQTRVDGTTSTVPSEMDEAKLNRLDIYMFQKGSGDTDGDYTFYKKYSFFPRGTTLNGDNEATWASDGSETTCYISVETDMTGTFKFALVANEPISTSLTNKTLANFKETIATNIPKSYDAADKLVDDMKNFPMTAETEATAIEGASIEISATLVRNVARIDICNLVPNLTVNEITLSNVNSTSYLFEGTTPYTFSSSTTINLNPIQEYTSNWTDGLLGTTKEDGNTYRVFYLYEQTVNSSTNSPKITIKYSFTENETVKSGVVDVYFQDTESTNNANGFIDVQRNYRYRITLGDGSEIGEGGSNLSAKVRFNRVDWNATHIDDVEDKLLPGSGDGSNSTVQ